MTLIYLKAIILAIVEGLTEFIPISSTGHMILIGDIIQFTGKKAATFEVAIQLGAILAVTIVYKDRFVGLIPKSRAGKSVSGRLLDGETMPTVRHIIAATAPFLVVGFFYIRRSKSICLIPSP